LATDNVRHRPGSLFQDCDYLDLQPYAALSPGRAVDPCTCMWRVVITHETLSYLVDHRHILAVQKIGVDIHDLL
jgi:hypothetical protein